MFDMMAHLVQARKRRDLHIIAIRTMALDHLLKVEMVVALDHLHLCLQMCATTRTGMERKKRKA